VESIFSVIVQAQIRPDLCAMLAAGSADEALVDEG
jgi:hypothetical protein